MPQDRVPILKRLQQVALGLLKILKRLQQEALGLLDDHRVASEDQDRLHPFKRFIHFWILVGRSFIKNRCMIRATALAYTTLLSLVPLLVVGVGVTTSLLRTDAANTRGMVEQVIDNLVPQLKDIPVGNTEGPAAQGPTNGTAQPSDLGPDRRTALPGPGAGPLEPSAQNAREEVIGAIMGFIRNSNAAGVGAISTLTLVLVAIGLLSTIEATFNDIWGVTRGRSWLARIVQYWAAITLGPLILLFATTSALGAQFESVQQQVLVGLDLEKHGQLGVALMNVLAQLGQLGHLLLPLFLLTLAFAVLYQLMPATSVNWKAAAVGGLVAGLLWWLNSLLTGVFTSKVVSYSTLYGGAAVMPVFLLGLYLSWVILLFGAQVSYAFQNRRTYLQEKQAEVVSQRGREFVALRMMTRIAQCFHRGDTPPTITHLSEELGVSSQLLARLIGILRQARLVTEVNTSNPGYLPARPLDQISCDDVLEVLRSSQGPEPFTHTDEVQGRLRGAYDEICSAGRPAARDRTLLMLVREDGTPPNT